MRIGKAALDSGGDSGWIIRNAAITPANAQPNTKGKREAVRRASRYAVSIEGSLIENLLFLLKPKQLD
jgi:hypothetical protein